MSNHTTTAPTAHPALIERARRAARSLVDLGYQVNPVEISDVSDEHFGYVSISFHRGNPSTLAYTSGFVSFSKTARGRTRFNSIWVASALGVANESSSLREAERIAESNGDPQLALDVHERTGYFPRASFR